MIFFGLILSVFLLSLISTHIVKKIALYYSIVDIPDEQRKKHAQPTPLLGGVALYGTLFLSITTYLLWAPDTWPVLFDIHVHFSQLIGFLIGGLFLVIGGVLDDRFSLSPRWQIIWPVLAAFAVIFSGSDVPHIRNPLTGGLIPLHQFDVHLFTIANFSFTLHFFSDLISFFWLLGLMYTTKILDGLDGLVAGITGIGSCIIALISFFVFVNIPTGMLSVIIFATCLGFLFHNSYPAKIFLGESGSTLCGFFLGVLSLISGAKFATGLLILGIPILDLAWVIFQRIFFDRRIPFTGGDRRHLHFRLLELGLSHRGAVFLLYGLSLIFGLMALFFQNEQKLGALSLLICVMGILVFLTNRPTRSS